MDNTETSLTAPPSIRYAFRQGWGMARRYWKISLIYWLASLLLALVAALPLRATLLAETGNSLLLNKLLVGFNYTYVNDFLQNYGSAFNPILNQSLLVLGLQVVLLLFLTGGLAKTVVDQPSQYDGRVFWGGSGQYFWRMLRLTLFFTVLHVLILIFFGWLYLKVTKGMSPTNLETEAIITTCLRWLVPLYVLVAALPMLWQDYAKVQLAKTDAKWIWSPVRQAGRFIGSNFLRAYGLYLLVLVLTLVLYGVNYLVGEAFQINSVGTVFISLLLTQLLVVFRFMVKVLNLGSISTMSR